MKSRIRAVLSAFVLALIFDSPAGVVAADYAYADLPGVRIAYMDAGGDGDPVVLVHALAGTSESWRYQIEPLTEAGYRVIAYDRRGWGKSQPVPQTGSQPGVSSEDLERLIQALGIDRFHLMGIAGGSFVAADYAAAHPDKLMSLVLSASTLGLEEARITAFSDAIRHPEVTWPSAWLEVGPSYMGENPEGLAEWMRIHEAARQQGAPFQPLASPNTFAKLRTIATPTLVLAAGADRLAPPGLMRLWAPYIKTHEWAMILDAGHSVAWERPEAFNQIVIEFLDRH